LFHRAVKYQLICLFPLVFLIVVGARQGVTLWLGTAFADNSYRVLQCLAIGVFINCLAQVPFSFLQGIGKPDVTSKLHVAELLFYLPALWFLVNYFGITGAAIAWTGRITIDTVMLFYLTRHSFRPLSSISAATCYSILATIVCLVCIVVLPGGPLGLAVYFVALLLMLLTGWLVVLSVNERSYLLDKLSLIRLTK
jgi:O-antigen/teichoic acid export membrane protein